MDGILEIWFNGTETDQFLMLRLSDIEIWCKRKRIGRDGQISLDQKIFWSLRWDLKRKLCLYQLKISKNINNNKKYPC